MSAVGFEGRMGIYTKVSSIKHLKFLLLGLALAVLLSFALFPKNKNAVAPAIEDFSGQGSRFSWASFHSQSRGRVSFNVYLPPGWSSEDDTTYPLLIFLHGQNDDENGLPSYLAAEQLNVWIEEGDIPPMVIIAPRGDDDLYSIQWFNTRNEKLLTSEAEGELRAFCRDKFKAGMNSDLISLQGHSRGASGALHFALSFPDKFASVISNAFVSDYILDERKAAAAKNRKEIIESGIQIRMMIGSEDEYGERYGRQGTLSLHRYLSDLEIAHEYEVIPQVGHFCGALFSSLRPDGQKTILYELKYHAEAWEIYQ